MSDIVGSARVTIQPDFDAFERGIAEGVEVGLVRARALVADLDKEIRRLNADIKKLGTKAQPRQRRVAPQMDAAAKEAQQTAAKASRQLNAALRQAASARRAQTLGAEQPAFAGAAARIKALVKETSAAKGEFDDLTEGLADVHNAIERLGLTRSVLQGLVRDAKEAGDQFIRLETAAGSVTVKTSTLASAAPRSAISFPQRARQRAETLRGGPEAAISTAYEESVERLTAASRAAADAQQQLAAQVNHVAAAEGGAIPPTNNLAKSVAASAGGFNRANTSAHQFTQTLSQFSRFRNLGRNLLAGFGIYEIGRFFKTSIEAARDVTEAQNKVVVSFKESAGPVLDFAKNAAQAFGQSERDALDAAGTFGNLFTSLGVNRDAAAALSVEMTALGSDLASLNNIPVDVALDKLRQGFSGQFKGLKALGVVINETLLKQKALELGFRVLPGKALDPAIRALATYELLLEQTSNAQGDFARTIGTLANQQRVLEARYINSKIAVGELLEPLAQQTIAIANDLIPQVVRLAQEIGPDLGEAFVSLLPLAGELTDVLLALSPAIGAVADVLGAVPPELITITALLGTFNKLVKLSAASTIAFGLSIKSIPQTLPALTAGAGVGQNFSAASRAASGFQKGANAAAQGQQQFSSRISAGSAALSSFNPVLALATTSLTLFTVAQSKNADAAGKQDVIIEGIAGALSSLTKRTREAITEQEKLRITQQALAGEEGEVAKRFREAEVPIGDFIDAVVDGEPAVEKFIETNSGLFGGLDRDLLNDLSDYQGFIQEGAENQLKAAVVAGTYTQAQVDAAVKTATGADGVDNYAGALESLRDPIVGTTLALDDLSNAAKGAVSAELSDLVNKLKDELDDLRESLRGVVGDFNVSSAAQELANKRNEKSTESLEAQKDAIKDRESAAKEAFDKEKKRIDALIDAEKEAQQAFQGALTAADAFGNAAANASTLAEERLEALRDFFELIGRSFDELPDKVDLSLADFNAAIRKRLSDTAAFITNVRKLLSRGADDTAAFFLAQGEEAAAALGDAVALSDKQLSAQEAFLENSKKKNESQLAAITGLIDKLDGVEAPNVTLGEFDTTPFEQATAAIDKQIEGIDGETTAGAGDFNEALTNQLDTADQFFKDIEFLQGAGLDDLAFFYQQQGLDGADALHALRQLNIEELKAYDEKALGLKQRFDKLLLVADEFAVNFTAQGKSAGELYRSGLLEGLDPEQIRAILNTLGNDVNAKFLFLREQLRSEGIDPSNALDSQLKALVDFQVESKATIQDILEFLIPFGGIAALQEFLTTSGAGLPFFGAGGIVNQPTVGIIGESGPEVVIPLSDPRRALELARQSGLLDILSKTSTPGSTSSTATTAGATSVTIDSLVVQVILPPGTSANDAAAVGEAVSVAAASSLRRRLAEEVFAS